MSGARKNATNSAASGSRRGVGDGVISSRWGRATISQGSGLPTACLDQGIILSSVMPAHSASEDARERAYGAGIHVFWASSEDVDGRDKPGHDASFWFDVNARLNPRTAALLPAGRPPP